MGVLALCLALGAVAALAVTGAGKFAAVGLGLLAIVTGIAAYRTTGRRAGARLVGAAAVAIGGAALLLGGAKVALTLIAVEHVTRLAP